jgi:hypothetical protein
MKNTWKIILYVTDDGETHEGKLVHFEPDDLQDAIISDDLPAGVTVKVLSVQEI